MRKLVINFDKISNMREIIIYDNFANLEGISSKNLIVDDAKISGLNVFK